MARRRKQKGSNMPNVADDRQASANNRRTNSSSGSNSKSNVERPKSDDPNVSKAKEIEEDKWTGPTNARTGNDPEWYSRDNQLVIDAASIPFSRTLGDPFKIADKNGRYAAITGHLNWFLRPEEDTNAELSDALPGILTCKTKSSFGTNTSMRSPANVAANMLYTHVRYNNSGRKNYEAVDLMMYVASMADIYSFIVWCERIYAKAFMYSQRNKYVGDMLLTSEGIDAESIKNNLANFRYFINTYINKVSSFAVPADIYYFNRRVWIYSGIYLENPDANIKDQLYQFSPDGFYRFVTHPTEGWGYLKYETLDQLFRRTNPDYLLKYGDLVWLGNWLFENINGDEDFGLMSGDILKAFDNRIIGLPSLPESAEIVPIYSEYVLEQFHNANVVDTIRGLESEQHNYDYGNLMQDPATGLLKSSEAFWYDYETDPSTHQVQRDFFDHMSVMVEKLVSVNSPTPTPVDVMEITRLIPMALPGQDTEVHDNFAKELVCGADIVESMSITYVDYDGKVHYVTKLSNTLVSALDLKPEGWEWLIKYRMFKYAPILLFLDNGNDPQITASSSDALRVKHIEWTGNINNFTTIDYEMIAKVHEVAMLSLLSVPGVAKMINF